MKAAQQLVVVFFAAVISATACPAWAEDRQPGNMQALRDKLQAGQKAFVTQNLVLTESEARAFWPVYDSYQRDLGKLRDRMIELIETYSKNADSMTDEEANNLVEEYLDIEGDRVSVRKAYLPKFRKILSPKKVARYYQIENKIFAIINHEAAARIPLIH